jgi:AraC-like DNA-binding protein
MQNGLAAIGWPERSSPPAGTRGSAPAVLTGVRLPVHHVHLPGEVESATASVGHAVALWVSHSRDGAVDDAADGNITLLSRSDLPHPVHADDVVVTSVLMDPSLVAQLDTPIADGQASSPVQFTGLQPVDAAAAALWRETVSYVKKVVLADDVAVPAAVAASAGRLLAAVAQATFPLSDTAAQPPHDDRDDQPVLLRRAVDFIDSNITNDISLSDIAESIHVTPRAVQYMFRRHLGTTPLQYLRRIRLHYAHLDLLAGDRRQDTVTSVASRWGFMHTGRFAVLYRQTYGQSPHATLRD